jgi:outer membrane immunogenic protein
MSRIRTLGASAAVLLASAGVAAAADIPPYGAPSSTPSYYNPAPAFSWSGPYAGLIGGFGWANTSPSTATNSGWIGGAFAGANFQTNTNLVVGVEGDFTATGKSGTSGGLTVSNPWDATLRGRIGFAMDKILVYGTGGLAVGRVKAVTTTPSSESATQLGWTVGAGVDAALAQNVIGRLEFRHTNLGTNTFPTAGAVSYKSNDVMAGIGFKF